MDLILEIGVNHENSFEKACLMIDQASKSGATAVKFQAYKADLLASVYSPAYWDQTKEKTPSQHELFKKYDKFNLEIYTQLKDFSDNRGIEFMLTCFDLETLDSLDHLVQRHKIASADITNKPLIEAVARTKKDILLSTGAATFDEIKESLYWIRSLSNAKVTLLHCVLNYPTPSNHADLGRIILLQKEFPQIDVGYSDHVVPDKHMTALVTAYQLGVRTFEKHFTFDKLLPGNDHYHAANIVDVQVFMEIIREVNLLMLRSESNTQSDARMHARRSLVAANSFPIGHVITSEDVLAKRPGHGISPADIDKLIGLTIASEVKEDTVLEWNMFIE